MPGQLFPLIDAHFNEEELRTLCLMLGEDYESLGGRGKTANARELADRMRRQGRLPELLARLQQERPLVSWPELPPDTPITDPLTAYHHKLAQELAHPGKEFDGRFVQLTLLLNKGEGEFARSDTQFQDLGELLHRVQERVVVLLGRPGCGKTTLLKRRQLEYAQTPPPGQTTFFARLNTYRGDPPPDPYDWLAQAWPRQYPGLPTFDDLFAHGRFLFLLDGLNEMPHRHRDDYEERIGRWQLFLQEYAHCGNSFVISCRSLDYSASLGSEEAPALQVQVEDLNAAQIEQFLERNAPAHAGMVMQTLHRDPRQLDLYKTPLYLRLLADKVAETGQMPTGRAALFTYFVRRALRREVEPKRPLFTLPELLSPDDRQRILHNWWADDHHLPDEGLLLPQLARLAYQMQAGQPGEDKGQVSLPETKARALLPPPQAQHILDAAWQLNVLDRRLDKQEKEIAFYHQLLQEYFAARVLAQQPEPARLHVLWQADKVTPSLAEKVASLQKGEPLPPLPATGWEQTALLAAAMTPDPESFVNGLIPANLPWAARYAAAPDVAVSDGLKSRLREFLRNRVVDRNADLRARMDAAEALAELGDPRFARRSGPHGDYLRPPLAPIPAGTYPIGDDHSQWDDEKPAHTVEMAAFEMGVFPVTNAEYALFMRARGYEDEQWWQTEAAKAWWRGESTSEGRKIYYRDRREYLQDIDDEAIQSWENWTPEELEFQLWLKHSDPDELEQELEKAFPEGKVYRQPEYWDDGRFNHPARPVVGICWFEALAYCTWLSAQTGERFDLPTEVEWEAAARGKKGRAYAYGPTFDPSLCNTFETHIRRTTPVGVFPGGQTPEGVADLCGNVWEWTTTLWGSDVNTPDFKYPYVAADGRENRQDPQSRRVVRGGSWGNNRNFARAAFRNHVLPVDRLSNLGIRVVRRPPSHLDL